jgi:NADH-quinone oxidoreductase subunit M
MKLYAVTFVFFSMASIGLPGTSGFVGEFIVLNGAFTYNSWVAFGAAFGVILGAAYMLYLVWRLLFGELTKDDVKAMPDLSLREKVIFAPLIAVVLWMGIYPNSFLEPIHASVANLIDKNFPVVAEEQAKAVVASPAAH